jgi:hypothetical protein
MAGGLKTAATKTKTKPKTPALKKQAAATLRSRAAGSQDESPYGAIHKFKNKFKSNSKAKSRRDAGAT